MKPVREWNQGMQFLLLLFSLPMFIVGAGVAEFFDYFGIAGAGPRFPHSFITVPIISEGLRNSTQINQDKRKNCSVSGCQRSGQSSFCGIRICYEHAKSIEIHGKYGI